MKTEFSLRPGVYALVAFAAPLALTTVLVWQDAPQISGFVLRNLLFSIACLVFSVALSVAIFRVAKIHLCSKQGSGLLLLIPLVGFLIFLAGSYVGSFGLHWAALPVVYFGVAAYLAGRRATELLLPSITAFGLIPAPSYFGAGALSALSYAMFAVAGVSALVAVRFRAEKDVECAHCNEYEKQSSGFCHYCGRILSPLRFSFSGRRLIGLAIATVLVGVAFSQTLPALEVSGSGLKLARYSPLGISYSSVLSGSGAWTASLRSFSSNSTSTILSYGIGGTKNLAVNVSVSISKSRSLSNGGALPHAAPTSVNGSLSIGRDQSGTIVIWSARGTEHTGLIWSISIHYIQWGAIQHGFITFLFSEETSAFRSNKGDDLVLPSQAAATNVGIAQQYDFEVANVLGPLLTIRDYAYSAGAVALIGVVAGIARNIDFSNARKFDECLGLNEGEFAVLAALSGVGARFSGAELLERNGIVRDWSTLSNLLEKFRRLGTMETGVAIRRGVPLVLWKSGVR